MENSIPPTNFLVPAGPGAFICSLKSGRDVSRAYEPMLRVSAHTWLSDDMLRDDQTPLIDDGSPGDRLGDSWLLPAPMRRVTMNHVGVARVESWAPGMPESRVGRKGRRKLVEQHCARLFHLRTRLRAQSRA
jgi:hypothetical protein